MNFEIPSCFARAKSGVALRLPPQSMMRWQKTGLSPGRAELQWNQP
jgi:predicted carbohydrate-binding protein with CBM5 and CBM33 domain